MLSSSSAPPPAPASDSANRQFHHDRPIRRRFATTGRVRSGCLTCKARKKKCDDLREGSAERCPSCARLGLVCERVPLRTVVVQERRREKGGERKREGSEKSNENLGSKGERGDNLDGASVSSSSSSRSFSPTVSGQATHRTPKDDDNRYSDDGVVDGNPIHREDLILQPAPPKTRSNGFLALFALDNASPERILLKYYVERLAPLCSILQEGSNEFRNVLLPMAIDDSSLLYALFAYASIHVPSSGHIPSITPLTRLKFESEAARGLSKAIRQNNVSESTVACALISSTAEVVSGDTKRWLVHLQGAGHLVNQLGGPECLRQTSDGRFLLRNFAYHDIMAAFSTSRRPLFSGMYWHDNGLHTADCLMGLAHEILGHISNMCYFIADTNDQQSPSPDFKASVTRRGEDLVHVLRSQTLDLCATRSGTELESLLHHAEAFRFSALLHLYRFLSRFAAASISYAAQMTDCVQNIMTHVYQVPANLYCEVGLVFPLFSAGISSVDDKVKASYIRDRLVNIESWTGFQHVTRAREVLESLWAAGRTDWQSILQKLDWQISLA